MRNPLPQPDAPRKPHARSVPRQCGPCTACCTVMRVSALDKPAGVACRHLCERGCGIYPDRPSACRDFTCLWLADRRNLLGEADRPDLVGLVLTEADHHDPNSRRIAAREVHAGAAAEPRAIALLAYLRRFVSVVVIPASAPDPAALPQPVALSVRGRRLAS